MGRPDRRAAMLGPASRIKSLEARLRRAGRTGAGRGATATSTPCAIGRASAICREGVSWMSLSSTAARARSDSGLLRPQRDARGPHGHDAATRIARHSDGESLVDLAELRLVAPWSQPVAARRRGGQEARRAHRGDRQRPDSSLRPAHGTGRRATVARRRVLRHGSRELPNQSTVDDQRCTGLRGTDRLCHAGRELHDSAFRIGPFR